jgi:uncharacterized protein YpiB (UPF0302 family)
MRNLQPVKFSRDVIAFFQEHGLNMKNNQLILSCIVILEHVCASLKVSENTEECVKNLRLAVVQVRNTFLSLHIVIIIT